MQQTTKVETLPSILLVEDDTPTRRRLSDVISNHPALHLIGAASTYAEAHRMLVANPPRVLLTDIGLPDGSGIELINTITKQNLATEAMVITVFSDEQHVFKAIEAGATGYLLKESDGVEVAAAILQLLAGGSPISPAIARHVLRRLTPVTDEKQPTGAKSSLTEREHEVLSLLSKGLSYAEVAEGLDMSPGTVTTHIKHIYRKLAVRSRGEAVFEAMQQGLLNISVP
ncbi:MAG: response regulator transcription factor [Candidatus Thiodiazotropha sp.]|jgi:DNA-binding NarL/FixJ family response regulator